MATTAVDLLKWLGQPTDDAALTAQAGQAITVAGGMIDAYTRGRHLTANGETRPGVAAVVLMVAARMLANPEQLRHTVGSVAFNEGFAGFTLAELTVLNRYRKRAA
ncbi:Uncharacterised protein (plasmid) [Tsukamurella tyrosinosolvens]|uniref:Phage gp6-like head-tail connector protein n=1 Tax=Tsukamurella tyrosinosolvens TaxID=57704 RepID=A0A1H4WLJ7_TSUTY|nr:hypothetical protein [Tsukamurella tyrosinosolvens]KXO99669.1 hypothetical protein AXK58_00095 [Tsukamurella tyrosinosolvens]SEC94197.1 hypothetical protein SAMN04489793_3603 [Tsukamurella tyrosinosolvens]VEH89436.1 Uncharacterised protein [Tsukamurella tyrosinosolvens]